MWCVIRDSFFFIHGSVQCWNRLVTNSRGKGHSKARGKRDGRLHGKRPGGAPSSRGHWGWRHRSRSGCTLIPRGSLWKQNEMVNCTCVQIAGFIYELDGQQGLRQEFFQGMALGDSRWGLPTQTNYPIFGRFNGQNERIFGPEGGGHAPLAYACLRPCRSVTVHASSDAGDVWILTSHFYKGLCNQWQGQTILPTLTREIVPVKWLKSRLRTCDPPAAQRYQRKVVSPFPEYYLPTPLRYILSLFPSI